MRSSAVEHQVEVAVVVDVEHGDAGVGRLAARQARRRPARGSGRSRVQLFALTFSP